MRVGFYLGELAPSDGGVYSLETALLEALSNFTTEHEIFIFTARTEKKPDNIKHTIIELPKDSKPGIFRKLADKIKFKLGSKEQNRALLNNEQKTFLGYLTNLHKIDLLWFFNGYKYVEVPYVMSVQDLQHRRQPYFPEVNTYGWKWNQREMLYFSPVRRAAYVISGSPEGKKDIEYFYQVPEERIHVIQLPAPIDALESFGSDIKLSTDLKLQKPYIFYPAQFWPHKNHITLLLAFKKLEEKFPGKFNLVLTGADKGNLSYIKEKIAQLNLTESTRYLGVVSRQTILSLYKNAHALVFPTLFGPDNLPPLEAFAVGCPVICGDLTGCKKYFGNGAIYIDPVNENEIAQAILRLSEEQGLRENLIKAGRERALMHTSTNYIEQIFKIINNFSKIRRCWDRM